MNNYSVTYYPDGSAAVIRPDKQVAVMLPRRRKDPLNTWHAMTLASAFASPDRSAEIIARGVRIVDMWRKRQDEIAREEQEERDAQDAHYDAMDEINYRRTRV